MNRRIRLATAADLPGIMAIEHASFGSEHWPEEAYRSLLAPPTSLSQPILAVVEVDAHLVACLAAHIVASSEADVQSIAVLTAFRRLGHAEALLQWFIAEYPRFTMYLEVRESNLPAQNLYLKAGFVAAGRRKRYYSSPAEDAILFTRPA